MPLAVLAGVLIVLILILNVIFAIWFHFSIKREPVKMEPKPEPAKLINKTEAWTEGPAYNYDRTSIMGEPVSPIEPGDSDPPEPYQ